MQNTNILSQSPTSVFFYIPSILKIDEDGKTQYATNTKIETLIAELKENGPMFALGRLGPNAYEGTPSKMTNKLLHSDVYYWQKGSIRKEHSATLYAVIIGAEIKNEKGYIYFIPSTDITPNSNSHTHTHKIATDAKIYVTSNEAFYEYIDLYPQAKPEPQFYTYSPARAELTNIESNYFYQLTTLSLLDAATQKEWKKLGQEIFDSFNTKGSCFESVNSLKKISNAIAFYYGERLRGDIERAWDGIGDKNWRWMA